MSSSQLHCDHGPASARGRFIGAVEFNRFICREHYQLRMRVREHDNGRPFPPTQPGQFIQLGCRPPDEAINREALFGGELVWEPGRPIAATQTEFRQPLAFLRRPFSLAGRGDDDDGTWLDVIHRVVGVGTQWLADLQPGDAVDLIGPLGNRFELPPDKSIGLLVGGGVGLPPMFYLAQAMRDAGWRGIAFVGAMTRDLLAVTFRDDVPPNAAGDAALCADEFARFDYPTVITTDDGTFGLPGRITLGLERALSALSDAERAAAVVFTCGPEPMMHAAAMLAERFGVDCQVCLEQAMACGMTTCQSCIVRIEQREQPHGVTPEGRPWRYRLACTDGPVFDSRVVVW